MKGSDDVTPSFSATSMEDISTDLSILILHHNFRSTISQDLELYRNFSKECSSIDEGIESVIFQENISNQMISQYDLNKNYSNSINRCNVCNKNEAERYHTCKECLDGYGLKEVDDCKKLAHRKVEKCYEKQLYTHKKDPRCKRIKYKYCKCKVTVPFGLCLCGFLLVVIGTGIFGGCWVYLAYASLSICNRSTYLHFFWYYIYAITIFMFLFTIIVLILMANSASRFSVCSVISNPGAGKNCSIIILIMIVIQCFIWMFLFTIVFYIGTEIYLLKNDSRALCGVIDMTLNYTSLYVGREYFSQKTLIIIFVSVLGATTVIIGLMLIIIGVSMNYQKMKAAISEQSKDPRCGT